MPHRQLHVTLRFLTPAFLGDAEQSGRWRTPPIKHLLREWWRVAYASDHGFRVDIQSMRREEGLLFGNAWLDDAFCKSRVRIRLDRWDEGALTKAQWPRDDAVLHPEVGKPVGSALYLGYGPLVFSQGTALKGNAAVQAGEHAGLSLAWPEEVNSRLMQALWLADLYGALGGRSRNGWGSLVLEPADGAPALRGVPALRDWKDCLDRDWPHAIGRDDRGPLVWQTAPHAGWQPLMKALATMKIGLRTQFGFPQVSPPHPRIEDRHWLAYPVTKHATREWDRNARLPNPLRFKVRRTPDGQLVGVIFHMPHLPPPAFKPDRRAIERVWTTVHQFLDDPAHQLRRINA